MIDWLRALSPDLRRSLYFVGVIVAFFVAVHACESPKTLGGRSRRITHIRLMFPSCPALQFEIIRLQATSKYGLS